MAYAKGGGVAVIVRAEIAELVGWLLEQTALTGYQLHQDQTGAFNCRSMKYTDGRPSQTPSNHSWGLAIDVNWNQNGFGYNAAHDLPDSVIELWEMCGFNWGGHWTAQAPDFMHFEFAGTPADADRLTRQLRQDEHGDDLVLDEATQNQIKLLVVAAINDTVEEHVRRAVADLFDDDPGPPAKQVQTKIRQLCKGR